VLVNEVVNRGGITFVHRAMEETSATAADVLRACVVVREVFDLPALWEAAEATDNRISTEAQTALYLRARRLMDRAVRWLLQNRRSPIDVSGEIERLRAGVTRLRPQLAKLFRGSEREALLADVRRLVDLGAPEELAEHGTNTLYSFGLLDVVEVARITDREVDEVAGVYFVLSERFGVDELLTKISMLPRDDRWQTLARMALRYDLYAALAALTVEILAATPSDVSATDRVHLWEQLNSVAIGQTLRAISEVDASRADLAAMSVLLRQIRTLVRTASA
jgi:glutamate dehydrogenase